MGPQPEINSDARLASAMRAAAREVFQSALADANIPKAFEKNIELNRGLLRVADDVYDLSSFSRVLVIALGKAARPMAEELRKRMGSGLNGIVVSHDQPEVASPAMLEGFRYFSGGHPLPTAESMRAAQAVMKTLSIASERALIIYLISGGASAMVEKPIEDDITLADLIITYEALVNCGAPIAEVNAIRKHLSAVKGGRLALAANSASGVENVQQVSIMVSDVPEDSLDALASGPTMPDSYTCDGCYGIAAKFGLAERFPASVRELFAKKLLRETPKYEDGTFHNSRWWPILSSASLQSVAAAAAARAGFAVEIDNTCDDWDYARAADYLLSRLRGLHHSASRVCLISAGEVTVRIPAGVNPGIGGRNQQFALHCAQKIAGENLTVMSAGSDGIDGVSPAAGAVVDGTTVARSQALGLDIAVSLSAFDAFPFFRTLGDAIITGPTGNNIRDLRALLAW